MVIFEALDNALVVRYRHEVLRIAAWGHDSVRVRAGQFRLSDAGNGALTPSAPAGSQAEVKTDDAQATLISGDLTVTVTYDPDSAAQEPLLTFSRTKTGAELLTERREHFWQPAARVYLGNRSGAYEIHQQFRAYDGEKLFGLGQRTHGRLDVKGLSLDLVQRNAEVNIPFVLSNRGYGLLWNNPAIGRVEFSTDATRWCVNQARELDYWITAADTPAQVLGRYADVTGHPPDLPEWASGFWQSKLRYRDQQELLEVAREHHRRGLPMSVIVADFFHWSAMGDYRFDDAEWPDPRAMVDELGRLGIKLMVSIWPTVSPLSDHFADYRDRGLLVGVDQGVELHQSVQDKKMLTPMGVAFYDPTNPQTRDYVWDLVEKNYLDLGVTALWLDACEPELNPAHPENLNFYAGPGAEVTNIYPRDNARLFADGMRRAERPATVLLCRSAWAGSQKYGAAVWSGDIPATWASLGQQIRAGQSIAISGIPWWTSDIGGFHGGDANDREYQELIVRWFQFGAFCPLFRLHGDREPRMPTTSEQSGGPNEVWSYGERAYEIIRGLLHLRERLRPYIHQHMRIAAQTGLPPMRPLFVDFPDDQQAWQVEDQFLFGSDLLIAPVYGAGQVSREVYLPRGRDWTDTATGRMHHGGQTLTAQSPLERIPVFLAAGSDLSLSTFDLPRAPLEQA